MDSPISFGVIADLQYCDADPEHDRYFRNSPKKLMSAISEFNKNKLQFIINLGDTIDRNWKSFDGIIPIFKYAQVPVHHVLGNHDYEIEDDFKKQVPVKIGTERYYDFSINGWLFIILDGNEISTYAHPESAEGHLKGKMLLKKLEDQGVMNANFWNGGIGQEQLKWLESCLSKADKNEEKVIIFCHFPIYPEHRHNLLNDREILNLIINYDCFKCWINGHNHDGNYGMYHNKHFVNLKGMVDTEFESAFSIIELYDDHLRINGSGNEISARLTF
jgi:hypothetical protein